MNFKIFLFNVKILNNKKITKEIFKQYNFIKVTPIQIMNERGIILYLII